MTQDSKEVPYRPSNGTEGMQFHSRFCERCSKDQDPDPCEIIFLSMSFDIDDPEYPKEWIYKKEEPTCTAYKNKDKKQ